MMSLRHLLHMLRPTPTPSPTPTTILGERAELSGTGATANPGGQLVASDGRPLPLRGVTVYADARGGIARVVLEQRFVNPYSEPLRVTYLLPLPAEAAVSGYAFVLQGRRIVGEVDRKRAARERFEQAILEGKSAGIVEQERSSLFTQELGNIPAGAEVVAELTLDQRLIWRSHGAWEWRFPTTVGPRYLGSPGQVPDADRLAVSIAEGGVAARLAIRLAIRDAIPDSRQPESPSHQLRTTTADGGVAVSLADDDGAALDRDIVVRWPVAAAQMTAQLDLARPIGATGDATSYGLMTLVPPRPEQQLPTRRDLILLFDTSGSMDGEPLRQLQRTARALIDTLGDQDTLEMIEFSSSPKRWNRGAKPVSAAVKRDAEGWIEALRAGGSTEMVTGMLAALAPLTPTSQRQVILMTDGYIGGESAVVSAVMKHLPRGCCRVHVVGVGSSINRTLTAGVARAGAGTEVIIGPGEDPAPLIRQLLARTAAPLLTGVEIRGSAILANAPTYLPDLHAGSPALISLQLRPTGGDLEISGQTATGPWRVRITAPACAPGHGSAALAALFARETVEDLELARTTTAADPEAIDRAIEDLGLRYQIATRLTTWVAISTEATVDPLQPSRSEVMPQQLPHGASVEGLGLRRGAPAAAAGSPSGMRGSASGGGMRRGGMPGSASGMPPLGYGGDPVQGQPDARSRVASPDTKSMRFRQPIRASSGEEDFDEDRATWLDAPSPPAASALPPAATGHGLSARLRHRAGRRLVLEITVISELPWNPETTVKVQLADGRTVTATAISASTTGAGVYQAGQVLRLVLELGPEFDDQAIAIAVTVAGMLIPIVLK